MTANSTSALIFSHACEKILILASKWPNRNKVAGATFSKPLCTSEKEFLKIFRLDEGVAGLLNYLTTTQIQILKEAYMHKLTLSEIQEIELDNLLTIDRLCQKLGLVY